VAFQPWSLSVWGEKKGKKNSPLTGPGVPRDTRVSVYSVVDRRSSQVTAAECNVWLSLNPIATFFMGIAFCVGILQLRHTLQPSAHRCCAVQQVSTASATTAVHRFRAYTRERLYQAASNVAAAGRRLPPGAENHHGGAGPSQYFGSVDTTCGIAQQ
jgi:hypothetical protein